MAEIEVDVAAGDSVMETRVNSTAKLYLTDRTLHYEMESQLVSHLANPRKIYNLLTHK